MAKETSINVFKKRVDLLVCIIKPVEQLHHSADNLRLEQNEKNSLLQTHTHTETQQQKSCIINSDLV